MCVCVWTSLGGGPGLRPVPHSQQGHGAGAGVHRQLRTGQRPGRVRGGGPPLQGVPGTSAQVWPPNAPNF